MPAPKSHVVSFWLPDDLAEALTQRAEEEGTTRNRLVRRILQSKMLDLGVTQARPAP